MKVVINSCYGGFGISKKAGQWLLDNGIEEPFMSEIAEELEDEWYGYMFDECEHRTHPLLVRCVEELGNEANGSNASLCVEEVEGKYYRISDYDGIETLITPDLEYFTKSQYE